MEKLMQLAAKKAKRRAAKKAKKSRGTKAKRLLPIPAMKVVAPKPLAGAMSAVDMARSFNEWMRQYIETPEAFQATFRTVSEFVAQEAQGREPDYGDVSARLMFELLDQLNGKKAA